jgi:GDP-L-fucose synthase
MKKIVIIGGFGFLGRNLQNEMKDSYEIYPISRQNGYDLLEKNKIKEFLIETNPDYIINCAAYVGSLDYVNRHAADVISTNLLLGINFWEILKDINYKGIVINPISNCTYPGKANIQKESEWWDGMVHPSIISYGSAKKTIFMLNKCYEKQYNIKTINIIIPNSYGEFDYDDENRVHALNGIVIRMLKMLKSSKKDFLVWGSGTPIREWGYMPDTSRFIKHIIDNNLIDLPNPINIGTGQGFTINEISEIIKNYLSKDIVISNDLSKIDGDPIKILDNELFNSIFPKFKFTSIEEGIKNTINYYKDRV